MHVITRRVARTTCRLPAKLIAGRRYPPQNLRAFHRTASVYDDSNPLPGSTDPNWRLDSGQDAREEGRGRTPEQAAIPQEVTEGVQENVRDKPRGYGSASRRSMRHRKPKEIPPITVPDWFLESNVALARTQSERGAVEEPLIMYVANLLDAANGTAAGSQQPEQSPGDGRASDAAGALSPLKASLDATASLLDSRTKSTRFEGHELRESLKKQLSELFSVPSTTPESTPKSHGGEAQLGAGGMLNPLLEFEIWTSIAASLLIARPDAPTTFPNAKSNVVLHCPQDGRIEDLERVVHRVAQGIGADVVTIDAQDIAEMAGEYLGEGSEYSSGAIRNLAYDIYPNTKPQEKEQDEDDAFEGEEEDADDFEGMSSFGKSPNKRGLNIKVNAIPISSGSSPFEAISKALMGRGSSPFAVIDASGKGAGMGAQSWEDLKLKAFLETLIDTNEFKKQPDSEQAETTVDRQDTAQDSPEQGGESRTRNHTVDHLSDEQFQKDSKYRWSLGSISRQSDVNSPLQTDASAKIVLIRDFEEMYISREGSKIVQLLTDIVLRRRKEAGEKIMLIGVTSSVDFAPIQYTNTAVQNVQGDRKESNFRTIITPFLAKGDMDTSSRLADAPKPDEGSVRNERINVRHLRDMVRRLDSSRIEGGRQAPADTQTTTSNQPWLRERIKSFDEVHRVALAAIGIQSLTETTEKVDDAHLQLAMALIRKSDEYKETWAEHERERRNKTAKAVKEAKSSGKGPVPNPKVQALKSLSRHEKKLTNGVVDPTNIRVTFSDVHAPDTTITALKSLTSLSLMRPDAFTYGVLATDKIPGLLLYGPPGTGKTMLAKAVAKESGATVLEVSGSEVYDMYVGEGEKNVKAIFTLARKLSPCVVFIDEADAIFSSRGGSMNRTTHREIINQFLREWDGLNDLGVFIMVATNRPFDLDDAVLRRLPRKLLVDLPVERDREAIFRIHLKDELLDDSVSTSQLAAQTPLYSGSDIKNLCVAAALACVREESDQISRQADYLLGHQQEIMERVKTDNTTPESLASVLNSIPDFAPEKPLSTEDCSSLLPYLLSDSPSRTQLLTLLRRSLPSRRVLKSHHFDKAMEEISASISEDMSSLGAIRKFDETYGDRKGRRRRGGLGFGDVPEREREEAARVRNGNGLMV